MDTTLYYAALREQRETLAKQHPSGFCLVVSVFDPQKNSTAGSICEVSVQDAARLTFDGTHRVATDDETCAYRNRQGVERARNRRDDLERTREMFQGVMGGRV
jgi:hypothetical protein